MYLNVFIAEVILVHKVGSFMTCMSVLSQHYCVSYVINCNYEMKIDLSLYDFCARNTFS